MPAVDGTVLTNTVQVSCNQTDPNMTNNTASQNTTVSAPNMQFTKTAALATDADGNGVPSPGDTISYTATIKNVGSGAATGVVFSDTPDANTTLVIGSVTTSQGFISKGNSTGNKSVEVLLGNIAGGSQAVVTFKVTINKPLWEYQVANQAIVTGANFSSVKSDDPGTPPLGDPTIMNVQPSPPVLGPGVTAWGIMAMVLLFGGAMVLVIRRKLIRSETH